MSVPAEQADLALPTTALLGAAILVVLVVVLLLLAPDAVARRLRYAVPFTRTKAPEILVARRVDQMTSSAGAPDHGPQALVRPLVLGGSHFAWTETPMPSTVLVHCRSQSAYFHGLCGHVGGTRLTVRAAALRGLEHAASRSEGKDAAGAAWDGRHKTLYAAVADGRSTAGSVDSARCSVQRVLKLADETGEIAEALGHRRGSTTMVAAIIRPLAKGAAVEIHGGGDCEAWLLTREGWHPLRSSAYHAPPGSVVVLGTDGFAGALGQRTQLAGELAARWRTPPTPLEFVAQLDFFDGYRTDDRAAVAVWIG